MLVGEGTRALIAGASRGIGRALAQEAIAAELAGVRFVGRSGRRATNLYAHQLGLNGVAPRSVDRLLRHPRGPSSAPRRD